MGRIRRAGLVAALAAAGSLFAVPTAPAGATPPAGSPAGHWTPERMAAATPRDLVLDARGRGYLRRADGTLAPHGHHDGQLFAATPTGRPVPAARPGGGGGGGGTADTAGPTITSTSPAPGATNTTGTQAFVVSAEDPSGVRSVTIVVTSPGGATQSFAATRGSGTAWTATISGFTTGTWTWRAEVRDGVKKGGGNLTTAGPFGLVVDTGTGGGGGGTTVTNSPYTGGGTVQTAAGRIYFEMPDGPSGATWSGYVCSGTVAEDGTSGRSVIITAAHCIYDDVNRAFARNVLFIPNQSASGTRTDTNCTNDWRGCWTPSVGVVDSDWATRTWPDNAAWDYGYYVVNDSGGHLGAGGDADLVLDLTAGDLPVSFTAPTTGTQTHALGYSYRDDPGFMYCAQGLGTVGSANWWLSQCGLSGGASGGPWLQPLAGGEGPIVSVNSWGYTNQPGMAGPRLSGSSASCLFTAARTTGLDGVASGITPAGC